VKCTYTVANVYYYRTTQLCYSGLGVVILSVCPSVCYTRALLLYDQSKESTGDIFIPHFNYSKHAVENGLSK